MTIFQMASVLVQKLACQLLDKHTCHIKIFICKIAHVNGLAN